MAETTQTLVAVNNLNLLTNYNVAENWKEGEDGGHCRFAVDDEKRDMVDFQAVGQVSYAGPAFVRVSDNDHFMTTINQFLKRKNKQRFCIET